MEYSPSLRDAVFWASLWLIASSALLFLLGHRTRRGNWAASVFASAVTGGAAWWAQQALTGSAPPPSWAAATALGFGGLTAALWRRWNPAGHAAFAAVLVAVATFMAFAAWVTMASQLGPLSLAFALLLLLLQVGALALLVAHTFEIIDVVCRTRWERGAGRTAVTDFRPTVSLHVPTHNEPPELVIATLDALARLDYPAFEVLVVDNNTADERLWRPVEQHCARLGPRFRFFHVMPWPGFKSGALNFALARAAPEAEIIGVVDADYVVEPEFLRDLVGHFADPHVAFVQTPQDYRDAAARGRYGRALYNAYRYFFAISMAARNERNAIIYAGTMGLIRRAALERAGGWDEWCITEDAELSVRLLAAGHASVYVDRPYGRGLMPLDYAGLKKQRFRWAFGGMQLLRKHARRLLLPGGGLTLAQRAMYLGGGLQWLNDPLSFAFTVILLVGAAALLLGGSLYLQPLVGAVVGVPILFIVFAVLRFLWALRVRAGCSWSEALDALTVLLGLTWVVTLACVRGLLSREGVFLRTPKQGDRPSLAESLRIVWWELLLAALCLTLAVLLAGQLPALRSGRTIVVLLLLWQATMFLGALRTSLWSFQAGQLDLPAPVRRAYRTLGHGWGRLLPEPRTAGWLGVAAALAIAVFYLGQRQAPDAERVMQADPLGQFLGGRSLVSASPEALAGAVLVLEAEAARLSDVGRALSLWDSAGIIVDANFTPDDPADDRAWRGMAELRARYEGEFRARRYRRLRHLNLHITVRGDSAVVVNDLDALLETAAGTHAVRLPRSDLWVLRRRPDGWRVVRLEVNRAALRSRS